MSNFQLSAQNGNIIENPSFEQFSGCSSYNEFQCGCYPKPFYQGCLGGAWKNATGTSALTNNWLNAGPAAVSGTYYAETRQYFQNGGVGNTHCSSFETFFYDFPSSTNNIPKLYAGQPYTLKLWYYGYNNPLQNENYKYNVHVDAVDGIINQIDNTACDDVVPNNLEIALHKDDISTFSSWVPLESNFTLAADKTQLWFKPELVQSSIPEGSYKTIDLFYDNISLTCNSLMTAEFQYTQNGSNYTFTLVKTGGPADVQIANVDWSFGDGTTGNGNPITKTISNNSSLHVRANFTDSRGCTKPVDFLLPSCGCSGNVTIISNSQTWNTPVTLTGGLILMPGSRLRVQANLNMAPNCKILVLKGARLNVSNSATIDVDDSSCNGVRWGGIEVLGAGNGLVHPSYSTITSSNNYPSVNEHGVVFLGSNSMIRRATTAISTLSTITSNPSYYGGIVIGINARFEDNIEGVLIGPFANDNVSRFVNCNFTGASASNSSKKYGHNFGIKLINNQGVQIATLDSGPNTGFYNMNYGVISENSGYYLNGYIFDHVDIGVQNTSTLPVPRTIFIGRTKPGSDYANSVNFFQFSNYGIKDMNVSLVNIFGNSFNGVKYGIDHRGPGIANVEQNSFATITNSVYMQNTVNASAFLPINIHCNNYNSSPIGINAFQNNQNAIFEEEEFNFLSSNSRDVVVWGDGKVTGTITPVLGTPSSGIVNIFGSNSRDFGVAPGNTVKHIYYAQPPVNNTYGVRWVPRCPLNQDPLYDQNCSYAYDFDRHTKLQEKPVTCLTNPTPSNQVEQYSCRSFPCLISLVNDYNTMVSTDTSYQSNGDYWKLIKEKEAAYNELFMRYTAESRSDSMTLLLSLENSEQNRERRIQFTINQKQYQTARAQIATLPSQTRDEIDHLVLWYLTLDKIEKDTNFSLQPDNRAFLEELAYDNRLYTPKAQAFLAEIDGTIFEPIQPEPEGAGQRLGKLEEKQLQIYPNPTSGILSITIPNFDYKSAVNYKVYNTFGFNRLSGTLTQETSAIDVSDLVNGAYIMQVESKGMLYYTKFIVVK